MFIVTVGFCDLVVIVLSGLLLIVVLLVDVGCVLIVLGCFLGLFVGVAALGMSSVLQVESVFSWELC